QDLVERPGELVAMQARPHLEVEGEQGDGDGEDGVGEGEHPVGLDRPAPQPTVQLSLSLPLLLAPSPRPLGPGPQRLPQPPKAVGQTWQPTPGPSVKPQVNIFCARARLQVPASG